MCNFVILSIACAGEFSFSCTLSQQQPTFIKLSLFWIFFSTVCLLFAMPSHNDDHFQHSITLASLRRKRKKYIVCIVSNPIFNLNEKRPEKKEIIGICMTSASLMSCLFDSFLFFSFCFFTLSTVSKSQQQSVETLYKKRTTVAK